MKCSHKYVYWSIFWSTLVLILGPGIVSTAPVQAQEEEEMLLVEELQEAEPIEVAGFDMFNPDRGKPQMIAAKRFHLKQVLSNEIRKIEAVCELDKKQKLKFRIGLKGAVKKLAEKWMKENEGQLGFFMNGPVEINEDGEVVERKKEPDKEAEPVEIPTINDADEIDEMMMQMVVMEESNPFKVNDPAKSKFWKKLVKETLREDQLAKLDEFRKQEKKQKLDILLVSLMAALDRELTLTDEQEAKLQKLIMPYVTDIELNTATFYEPFLFNYHASKASERGLKAILTPDQVQQWKFFMAPAKQIGMMMEMDNGMGDDIAVEFANEVTFNLLEGIGEAILDLFSK